jgi:hypothetical protein
MNSIDTEIQQLQARIAELEKTKVLEKNKNLSVSDNLEIINNIIKDKKRKIANNSYSKSIPLAGFYDQELVTRLEAISNILQEFNERLIKLENKN